MGNSAWKGYLLVGVVLGAAHFVVPSRLAQGAVYLGLAVSGVLAALVGVRRHRPSHPLPWYLFAAGLAVFLVGDGFFYFYKLVRHVDRPFPSVADAFYLGSYPLLIAGLLLIVRRRSPGGSRSEFIDAAIISTAVGLLAWVYLMEPSLVGGTPLLERLISVGYPLMDVLLVAVAVRLALAAGARRPAYYLLGLAVVCLLGADVAYAVIQLTGSFDVGTPFDAGWMGFYVFCGAAALHPSMRTLSDPGHADSVRISPLRLVVLGGVVLLAPGVLALHAVQGSYRHVPVIAAGSIALFVLVMVRMAGLMKSMSATTGRERALRHAAAALVASTDREGIYAATVAAARDLAGDRLAVVRLLLGAPHELVVVSSGQRSPDCGIRGNVVPAEVLAVARGSGDDAGDPVLGPEVLSALGMSAVPATVIVAPLLVGGEPGGAIVVASERSFPVGVADAVHTLASQVALAVESAAVTEDLHIRQSEARFRSLVQNSSDAISLVDPDTVVRYQTASVEHVLGYHPNELVGTRLLDLVHPEDTGRLARLLDETARRPGPYAPVEVRMRRSDGQWIDVETISNNMLADTNVRGIVLTTRDISERKQLERQLTHQALHDPLTNLANRALLIDRIEHAINRRDRGDAFLAVLFVDLDDFKTVNDALGHTVGDQALVAAAETLASCLRSGDTAARLGGDEFGILLEDLKTPAEAYEVGGRLLERLREPFTVDGNLLSIDASLGIVVTNGQDDDATELVRNADLAMYNAKGQGKGRYEIFEIGMHAAVVDRLALKGDLGRGLEQGQFVSHYQPIVELDTGTVVGVEALVRWQHPVRGLVFPLEFVPLAEDTGLIVPIGLEVLRKACQQVVTWDSTLPGCAPLRVNVNLSARQLQDPALVADVSRTLREVGIDPRRVTLEITESILMADTETSLVVLRKLKALGVRLALDDFGTGYSSLSYLQRFPVDALKLDKSFVDCLSDDATTDQTLARAIVSLGDMLSLQVTAEGIEDGGQLTRLRQLGCALGQGYYFSKPMAAEEMEELLRTSAGQPPDVQLYTHTVHN